MRGPKPLPIDLSESQRNILQRIVRRQTSPQRQVRRARILLEIAAGSNNDEVARRLQVNRYTVKAWRERWRKARERLTSLEEAGDQKALAECIEAVLDDRPRPGTPATFSSEQIVQIVALACEKPQECGRPVSHWTPVELAEEAVKREIVESISPRSVGRFLKGGGAATASLSVLAERKTRRSRGLCRTGGNGVCDLSPSCDSL